MRKLAILGVLALAGCGTPTTTPPQEQTQDAVTYIDVVQQGAITLCGYLPFATSIFAAYGTQDVRIAVGTEMAKMICDQFGQHAGALGQKQTLVINGVTIDGMYVGTPTTKPEIELPKQ